MGSQRRLTSCVCVTMTETLAVLTSYQMSELNSPLHWAHHTWVLQNIYSVFCFSEGTLSWYTIYDCSISVYEVSVNTDGSHRRYLGFALVREAKGHRGARLYDPNLVLSKAAFLNLWSLSTQRWVCPGLVLFMLVVSNTDTKYLKWLQRIISQYILYCRWRSW